jgi:signal transduction histidine kinase/PAS domain-containing protein
VTAKKNLFTSKAYRNSFWPHGELPPRYYKIFACCPFLLVGIVFAILFGPLNSSAFFYFLIISVGLCALLMAGLFFYLICIALRLSNPTYRFDSVLSKIELPCLLVDDSGKITAFNVAAQNYFSRPLSLAEKLDGEISFVDIIGRTESNEKIFYKLLNSAADGISKRQLFHNYFEQENLTAFASKYLDRYFIIHVDNAAIKSSADTAKLEIRNKRLGRQLDQAYYSYASIDNAGNFIEMNTIFAKRLNVDPEKVFLTELNVQDVFQPSNDMMSVLSQNVSAFFIFPTSLPAASLETEANSGSKKTENLDTVLVCAYRKNKGEIEHSVSGSVYAELIAIPTTLATMKYALQLNRDLIAVHSGKENFDDNYAQQLAFNISAVNNAPIGILRLSTDGTILHVNKEGIALLGNDCAGHKLQDFLCESFEKDFIHTLNSTFFSDKVTNIEAVLNTEEEKNNLENSKHMIHIYLCRSLETETLQVDAYIIDKSEWRKLEEQFIQSQKMQAIGQLAGGIAHDFNNILTVIIGHCELILLDRSPGDHDFADLNQIYSNANRASGLVHQLLAFSRKQTLQLQILHLTDVLAEISHLLNRLIGETVDLEVFHHRDLYLIKADQGQIEQILVNLVVNARDAMPNGGKIVIRTQNISINDSSDEYMKHDQNIDLGEYVCITVTDTGEGIDEALRKKIFEPFFTTKAVGKGSGLGLSTVYGIVKQLGGFITVDNKPEHGTTFGIYFPVYHEDIKDTEEMVSVPKEDLSGIGKILLVEDEAAVRDFVARALKLRGYDVVIAASPEIAIETIRGGETTFDLLLSDVVMPGMDGPTMLKTIREYLPDLKVVFMSGYAEDSFRKNLDDSENFAFMTKPFSLKQLAKTVKNAIEQ